MLILTALVLIFDTDNDYKAKHDNTDNKKNHTKNNSNHKKRINKTEAHEEEKQEQE